MTTRKKARPVVKTETIKMEVTSTKKITTKLFYPVEDSSDSIRYDASTDRFMFGWEDNGIRLEEPIMWDSWIRQLGEKELVLGLAALVK